MLVITLALCLSGAIAACSIPAGWTCAGSRGSSGADGVVPLSPAGNPAYEWISTNEGILGVGGLAGVTGAGGRAARPTGPRSRRLRLRQTLTACLSFDFNYTTTDGGIVSDHAWVELVNSENARWRHSRRKHDSWIEHAGTGGHAESLDGHHPTRTHDVVAVRFIFRSLLPRPNSGLRHHWLGEFQLHDWNRRDLLPAVRRHQLER